MKNPSHQQTLGIKANLMKYLNPSTLIQPKAQRTRSQLSNIHCRSMQDLDLNLYGASQSSKENIKSNIHHSSLYNDKQNGKKTQNLQNKTRSLSKFITFFQNSNLMGQVKKQTNENKKKNYNGFCYDLKMTGNSTGGNNAKKNMKKKDKENINYQTLTNQRQLHYVSQTRSPMTAKIQTNNNFPQEIQKIYRIRQTIEEYRQRQSIFNQKISQFEQRQQQFGDRIKKLQKQNSQKDKKLAEYQAKIRQLQAKNKQTIQKYRSKQHKSSNKESRQQSMVVKSLKKVINQQLNKIIELERVKIENQYLKEKLGSAVDDSFSQSSFSNNDYSFEYDTQKERQREQSLSSTIRSRSDSEFNKEMFKKTKPMKDQQKKETSKQSNKKSSRHFKSFFQVEESPISQSQGNIMNLFKPYESRKKNTQGKTDQNRDQQSDMIKICQPESSFTRQAIQEVNEEQNYDHELSQHKGSSNCSRDFDQQEEQQEENSDLRQESDSILQEVDEYLTKWRNQHG